MKKEKHPHILSETPLSRAEIGGSFGTSEGNVETGDKKANGREFIT